MEQQLADGEENVRLFIQCNPHNPSGRVWTEEELRKMGDLCQCHGIWIISDEIHCDLLRKGQKHIPLAKLFPDNDHIIICTAPSKTFNIAGSPMSHLFISQKSGEKRVAALVYRGLVTIQCRGYTDGLCFRRRVVGTVETVPGRQFHLLENATGSRGAESTVPYPAVYLPGLGRYLGVSGTSGRQDTM
jgi:hypothetical protein